MSDNVNRIIQKAAIGEEKVARLLDEMAVMDKQIDELRAALSEAREALDEREIASGLTSDGNLWRYWAAKAKDLALKNAALECAIAEKRDVQA